MDFITLGIGPGGDITSFLLVGLIPGDATAVYNATAYVDGAYVVSESADGAFGTSSDVDGRYVVTRDDVIGSL